MAAEQQPSSTVQTSNGSSLKDNGLYYLNGPINYQSAASAITWILEANIQAKSGLDHLTLMITSPGGEVFPSFALVDVMRGSKIPIWTVGLGIIASSALITFIAGVKGHRIITPNTNILSHQWTWASIGKEHELLATVKQYDLIADRMIKHYKKCTGMKEKVIREKLLPASDVWLDSTQALEYGLCDEVKEMG